MITKEDIKTATRGLGLGNQCVCVHASLKSFGTHVDGGAPAVINALLEEGCTVMVFAMSYSYACCPPAHLRPARNATDYAWLETRTYDASKIFTPESNEMDQEGLGLIPHALVNMPSRKRGNHPLNSFAAVGPLAEDLVSGQTALDVYAPLRKLCELGGHVLLMGVDLNKATLIHYAEQVSGRALFVRWANNARGEPDYCHTGGCSAGFTNFAETLKPVEKNALVGSSLWKCFPARDMLERCAGAIRKNPAITHCGNPGCERCNDAVAGGPVWENHK